ncbi:hypothetical protein [Pannonibacter tanglangensis]|uniref:Uncharacterized protein n=1 Tax=Pannonibacter tanglangensis TaxID=2750084 RepID=A0ABW9ZBQ6_9HYPH|nr:hypothetical protein [Pannonibacter sp. XCT-34]NBN62073.1 hypothetical protein [Pannonibacter sp. XCT-34]
MNKQIRKAAALEVARWRARKASAEAQARANHRWELELFYQRGVEVGTAAAGLEHYASAAFEREFRYRMRQAASEVTASLRPDIQRVVNEISEHLRPSAGVRFPPPETTEDTPIVYVDTRVDFDVKPRGYRIAVMVGGIARWFHAR